MGWYVNVAVGFVVVVCGFIISKKVFGAQTKPTRSLPPTTTQTKGAPSEEKQKERENFLDRSRQTVTLSEKIELSHDTKLFRFELPSKDMVLGLPVGKHFKVYCPNRVGVVPGQWNGREDPEYEKKEIQRSYTPTTSNDDLGYFDLVVKVYSGGVVDRFP